MYNVRIKKQNIVTQKIKTGFKNKEISMNFIEKINKSSRKFDVIKKEKKEGKREEY